MEIFAPNQNKNEKPQLNNSQIDKPNSSEEKLYPGIPGWVFDQLIADINSYKGNQEVLKFKQEDVLTLSINSKERIKYQILDARNGHYFLAHFDPPENQNKTQGIFLSSREPRDNKENPDLIVCSQKELESWMK